MNEPKEESGGLKYYVPAVLLLVNLSEGEI